MQFANDSDLDIKQLKCMPKPPESPDYTFQFPTIANRLFLVHTVKCFLELRFHLLTNTANLKKQQKMKESEENDRNEENEENEQQCEGVAELNTSETRNITDNDECIKLVDDGIKAIHSISKQDENEQMTSDLMMSILYNQFKSEIRFILLLEIFDIGLRLLLSILFKRLFSEVDNIGQLQSMKLAYLLATCCGATWYINVMIKNSFIYEANMLVARMKSQLIFMIAMKLSKLSPYNSQQEQIGTALNLISNNLNNIEAGFQSFLQSLVAPLGFVGIIVISTARFGWPSTFIVTIIIIFIPLHFVIGKIISNFVKQENAIKDQRIKNLIEVLEGIKLIKFYHLETKFIKTLEKHRKKQMKDYILASFLKSIQRSLSDVIADLATFTCFIFIQGSTKASVLLSTASILATVNLVSPQKASVFNMANSFAFYMVFKNTLERFSLILNLKTIRMVKVQGIAQNQVEISQNRQKLPKIRELGFYSKKENLNNKIQIGQIILQQFCSYWDLESKPCLDKVSINIKPKCLLGITGKNSSGKSSFLASILGQIPYYSGNIAKKGRIAYVCQQPVIFAGTIRQNILFGLQYQSEKYNKVLKILGLYEDLDVLSKRDKYVVVEKGLNLSLGQRVKISFARALYYDPDIYLFDDPISAIDEDVANMLYKQFVQRYKGNKTILLITQQLNLLRECDQIISIQNGKIIPFQVDQMISGSHFQLEHKQKSADNILMRLLNLNRGNKSSQNETINIRSFNFILDILHVGQKTALNEIYEKQKLMKEVSCDTYRRYFFNSRLNYALVPICVLLFILTETLAAFYIRFIAEYDNIKYSKNNPRFESLLNFWVFIGILIAATFVFNFLKYFILYITIFFANKAIHKKVITGLVRSPCSYFDNAPINSLTNKLSNDLGMMDGFLFSPFLGALEGLIGTCILFASVASIDKFFLIPGFISITLSILFFMSYRDVQSAVRKLDLRLKTPVYRKIRELIVGLTHIRIMNRRIPFLHQFAKHVNQSQRANISYTNIMRALSVVLAHFSVIMVWVGFIIGIAAATPESSQLYAASVIFLTQLTDKIQNLIKQTSSLQSNSISTQRLLALTKLKQQWQDEQDNFIDSSQQSQQDKKQRQKSLKQGQEGVEQKQKEWWPHPTSIELQNFSFRYRNNYPMILRNINLEIFEKQKVGIVGKTGSGKTSLTQALVRLYEPEPGSRYSFGGYNALNISLKKLRTSIQVITQVPFIFEGTVRQNIDIYNTKDDSAIWQSLSEIEMKQFINKLPNKLQTQMSEISISLSICQKQLLCFARALLNKFKILILDEATSHMDKDTSQIIHECVAKHFKDITVINITSKLVEVAGYDKIVVLEKGLIVETGKPLELIKKEDGYFEGMLAKSGYLKQQFMSLIK